MIQPVFRNDVRSIQTQFTARQVMECGRDCRFGLVKVPSKAVRYTALQDAAAPARDASMPLRHTPCRGILCAARVMILGLLLLVLAPPAAHAWGPHSQITQAALDALGTNDAFSAWLGPLGPRLTNFCWMGDYFGVVMEDADELFLADDYLLFPDLPKYVDHTGPDVRQAFSPVFKRALQAMRTENRVNAARWIGTLLHFVQDAGCPAHAAGVRGDIHSHMEWWLDADQIRLPDHAPQLLGDTDTTAYRRLVQRLNEEILDARERGTRLVVPVGIGNRSAVKPVMLESALKSARLTADLLHTLGKLAGANREGTAALRGMVMSPSPPGMERFPAKVTLSGTAYATLADLAGRYEFRDLPPGKYTALAYRIGTRPVETHIVLEASRTNRCDFALPQAPVNLVPNGDFALSTMRPKAPDYWYQTKGGWEGQPILLKPGQRYRLRAEIKEGVKADVLVRWMRPFDRALPRYQIDPKFESRTLTATNRELKLTGDGTCGLLHLTLKSRNSPALAYDRIVLEPVPKE